MLRDRLVCQIADPGLQHRLLAEPDLTFKKALQIAQAQETAEEGAKQIQQRPSSVPSTLNKVVRANRPTHHPNPGLNSSEVKPCYRCVGQHRAAQCQYKEVICRACNKKGHLARVCHSAQKATPGGKQWPTQQKANNQIPVRRKSQSTHQVEMNNTTSEEETDSYQLFNLQEPCNKPLEFTMLVNQKKLSMEIDTGATLSLISEKTFKTVWPDPCQQKL